VSFQTHPSRHDLARPHQRPTTTTIAPANIVDYKDDNDGQLKISFSIHPL
jgi:hypothetical protein